VTILLISGKGLRAIWNFEPDAFEFDRFDSETILLPNYLSLLVFVRYFYSVYGLILPGFRNLYRSVSNQRFIKDEKTDYHTHFGSHFLKQPIYNPWTRPIIRQRIYQAGFNEPGSSGA
jgi:hypothetical protein